MRRTGWETRIISVALLSAIVTGCSPSSKVEFKPVENVALEEIGRMYRVIEKMNKNPPQGVNDFLQFERIYSNGVSKLKSGEIIPLCGMNAGLSETSEAGRTVLAYEKKVPEAGGLVLMQDTTIKPMTADEFKAAPKAGGK